MDVCPSLVTAGATFDEHPKEGETPKMNGSMLIVMAESEQEIRDTLSKDIYATSGVWDVANVSLTVCILSSYWGSGMGSSSGIATSVDRLTFFYLPADEDHAGEAFRNS